VDLQLCWGHLELWIVGWVLVEVREEDGLRVRRLDMFARASVTMSASSNLVVDRAVHLGGGLVDAPCQEDVFID
jgi:hypothetical protein